MIFGPCRFNLRGDIPWRKIFAACGATLLVISDTFLAINKFCWPIAGERYIVMVTYYAAQLCIALSVVNSCVINPGGVAVGDQKNRNFLLNGTGVDGGIHSNDVVPNPHQKNGNSWNRNHTHL